MIPPPDNEDRANWAQDTLGYFKSLTRCDPGPEAMRDLLCNMMHLADRWGIRFQDQLNSARSTYRDEVREDGGKCEHTTKWEDS